MRIPDEEVKDSVIQAIEACGKAVMPAALSNIRVHKVQDAETIDSLIDASRRVQDAFAELALALRQDRVIIIPTEVKA